MIDFTGELQGAVERAVRREPSLEFEEISRKYLANAEGRIELNQISPRCYEAVALRTAMILYPGEYSGPLEAWRHYIPLAKDHSNMDEVMTALGDRSLIDEMTECTYREVASARENSYGALAEIVDESLESTFASSMAASGSGYRSGEYRRLAWRDFGSIVRRLRRAAHLYTYILVFRWLFGWATPSWRERLHRRMKWLRHVVSP